MHKKKINKMYFYVSNYHAFDSCFESLKTCSGVQLYDNMCKQMNGLKSQFSWTKFENGLLKLCRQHCQEPCVTMNMNFGCHIDSENSIRYEIRESKNMHCKNATTVTFGNERGPRVEQITVVLVALLALAGICFFILYNKTDTVRTKTPKPYTKF